jgi:hypothetical protein
MKRVEIRVAIRRRTEGLKGVSMANASTLSAAR